jgi:hypothetical protein
MLYREISAVCSEIHTKHINTRCGQNAELLNVKLAVKLGCRGMPCAGCHYPGICYVGSRSQHSHLTTNRQLCSRPWHWILFTGCFTNWTLFCLHRVCRCVLVTPPKLCLLSRNFEYRARYSWPRLRFLIIFPSTARLYSILTVTSVACCLWLLLTLSSRVFINPLCLLSVN